jgi:hypothetical protein
MVRVDWDIGALDALNDPDGEVGRAFRARIVEPVVAQAKLLAKKRTGRMAAEIRSDSGRDAESAYFDVVSPAQNPKSGFPYPIMHERRKTHDKVPQPSLRPAVESVPDIAAGL